MGFWVPSPFQFADTWRIAQNAAPLASDIVEAICWCEIRKLSHLGPGRTGTGDKLMLMDTFYILMARLCKRFCWLTLWLDPFICGCYVLVMSLCTVHSMPRDLWNKVPWEQGRTGHPPGFQDGDSTAVAWEVIVWWCCGMPNKDCIRLVTFLNAPSGFRSPFLGGKTICRPSLLLNLIMMKMMMTTTGHWNHGTMESWRMRCQLILVLMNWNHMNEDDFGIFWCWWIEIIWTNGFSETLKSSCCLQKCFLRL